MNDNQNNSDYIFKAFVVNTSAYDNGYREDSGAWLYFPPHAEDIKSVFDEICLPHDAAGGQYFIDDYVCKIESIKNLFPMHIDIDELAAAAERLNNLDPLDIVKLNAVMETDARFENLEQLKEFTYNREYFDFMLNVCDETELGVFFIYQSGIFDVPDYMKDAINPTAFGKYVAEAEQGVFTSKGYLALSGDEWQNVDLKDFTPKPLRENSIMTDRTDIDTTTKLAADLDGFYRENCSEYADMFDKKDVQVDFLANLLRKGDTKEIRTQLHNMAKEYYLDQKDIQPFLQRVSKLEKCKGIEQKSSSVKEQLRQMKQEPTATKPKPREECL